VTQNFYQHSIFSAD